MFFHSKEMSHIDIIWHCGGKAVIATSLLLLEVANIFSLTILRAFYDTNIYWKPSWDKWPWVDLDMSVVINNHMRPGMIKSRNIHILLSVMPLWTKTSIWCYSKGVFFCIPVVSQAWGCSQPNTYFTNDFPLVFQIRLETSCYNSNPTYPFATNICTHHHNTAALLCAKFCSDHFIIIW